VGVKAGAVGGTEDACISVVFLSFKHGFALYLNTSFFFQILPPLRSFSYIMRNVHALESSFLSLCHSAIRIFGEVTFFVLRASNSAIGAL